jgi:hypothetical protein
LTNVFERKFSHSIDECSVSEIPTIQFIINNSSFYLKFAFFRQVISLLTDIVYFLACQDNNGSDPFDVQILKANRERQKLIREQNILKQVNSSTTKISTYLSLSFNSYFVFFEC